MIDLNVLGKEQMDIRRSKRHEKGEKLKKPNIKINMEKNVMRIEKWLNIHKYC
jgi:hypothetical protein